MRRIFLLLFFLVCAGLGLAAWWLTQPLHLSAPSIRFLVPEGASVQAAGRQLAQSGVDEPDWALTAYFRWFGRGRRIHAGEYELHRGETLADALGKMQRGERIHRAVTLIEGWNLARLRQALAQAEGLKQDTLNMSEQEIMRALGRPGLAGEGRFYPETYSYTRGDSDLQVLRQALDLMQEKLDAAWDGRDADLPLKNADEALILASIIEKETGRHAERAEIAGVFINRLRQGMPLQTDPTIIYGLGADFDGRLRRTHLRADGPFNTYTRKGLPPTPIAMPGQASLEAALHPAQTKSLYFVSRGDGSSHFSQSLQEHNRAVNKYQRGGK